MKHPFFATAALLLIGIIAVHSQPQDDHHGKPLPQTGHSPAGPPPRSLQSGRPADNSAHAGPALPDRAPTIASAHGRPSGPIAAVGRHSLPRGVAIPTARHAAPMWNGRSWAIGDVFVLAGFTGPTIADWGDYALPPPRRGTHWIFVDGWYLMVGNRTGHIFAEIPADY